jgi:hypothetical protein
LPDLIVALAWDGVLIKRGSLPVINANFFLNSTPTLFRHLYLSLALCIVFDSTGKYAPYLDAGVLPSI